MVVTMSNLKTTNIKGRNYVEVNVRLQEFRKSYEGWSLESDFVEINENYCVIKAIIKNKDGVVKATGLAREVNGDTFINKTSYVENCETSAWGRALGNLGIGIDEAIASSLEVTNAVNNKGSQDLQSFDGVKQALMNSKSQKQLYFIIKNHKATLDDKQKTELNNIYNSKKEQLG